MYGEHDMPPNDGHEQEKLSQKMRDLVGRIQRTKELENKTRKQRRQIISMQCMFVCGCQSSIEWLCLLNNLGHFDFKSCFVQIVMVVQFKSEMCSSLQLPLLA